MCSASVSRKLLSIPPQNRKPCARDCASASAACVNSPTIQPRETLPMSDSGRVKKPRNFAGLDAGRGPARPLSPADTEWLVEQVVQRALDPERSLRPRRLSPRALSLAGLVVVTSVA